jgi:hypothetical protein
VAEATVQLPPDSTGSKLRTETNTQAGSTVHQQVISIADSAGNLITATSNKLDVNATGTVALQGDATAAGLYSVDYTLGTADTVSSFAVPSGARGFRILSASARLRYRIDANPPNAYAAGSGTSYTVDTTNNPYNTVLTAITETRLFQPGATVTTLRINSESASATFTLEFF